MTLIRGKMGPFVGFIGIAALVLGGLAFVTREALRMEEERRQANAARESDRQRAAKERELYHLRKEQEQSYLEELRHYELRRATQIGSGDPGELDARHAVPDHPPGQLRRQLGPMLPRPPLQPERCSELKGMPRRGRGVLGREWPPGVEVAVVGLRDSRLPWLHGENRGEKEGVAHGRKVVG